MTRLLLLAALLLPPLGPARSQSAGPTRGTRTDDIIQATRTERALRGALDRDGLIAGTSAGATIQQSDLVRGAPAGNTILMSPGHETGFGHLTDSAVDQHVIARHRVTDLSLVVAAHPALLGIGIDEATAILVQSSRLTVLGRDVVLITDGADHDGRPYLPLVRGQPFDLATRSVVP
jgi:cyanophycinase